MQTWRRVLFATTVVVVVLSSTHGIRFDVDAHTQKCVGEEVPGGNFLLGEYGVDAKGGHEVLVLDEHNTRVYHNKNQATGHFAFTAAEGGEYRFCVQCEDTTCGVNLDLRTGVEAQDYVDRTYKKENLVPVETELRRLQDRVQDVMDEMLYMREREASMRDTNESTNTRVMWFSIFSMILLMATGVWQIVYLASFFRNTKPKII